MGKAANASVENANSKYKKAKSLIGIKIQIYLSKDADSYDMHEDCFGGNSKSIIAAVFIKGSSSFTTVFFKSEDARCPVKPTNPICFMFFNGADRARSKRQVQYAFYGAMRYIKTFRRTFQHCLIKLSPNREPRLYFKTFIMLDKSDQFPFSKTQI